MLGRVDVELMPIGRFARLCRLSVKQLRHYDDVGLLRPAWVDPDSGYRYYRSGQAREALPIGLFPLDIAEQASVTVAAQVEQEVPGTTRDILSGGLFAVATHVGPYGQDSLPHTPYWPGPASTVTRRAANCTRSTSPIRCRPPRINW